jgi:5-methylcytosine-specific restriction endonuclease McrA
MAESENRIISRQDAIRLDLKRYFTGKPCKRGHLCERITKRASCSECDLLQAYNWAKANPDIRREMSQRCRAKNLERERARSRRWIVLNKEKYLTSLAKYRAKEKASRPPQVIIRKPKTPKQEKAAAYHRAWKAQNRERVRALHHNRKARKRGNGGAHTGDDIKNIFKAQKGKCAYCKSGLSSYHVDHIIPISRGGTNGRRNIQILCQPCNLRKSAKDPIDFARMQGMLL